MSQSDQHRDLVLQVGTTLQERFHNLQLVIDVQKAPSDKVPPLIGGYRPDVYGQFTGSQRLVIAEAKTDNDIKNEHTREQVKTFINHIESEGGGLFVLSVTNYASDSAKTLMRFLNLEVQPLHVDVAVYDRFFFWWLEKKGGVTWHLN